MKHFRETCGKKMVIVLTLGLFMVTAGGCGKELQELADLPGRIADGEFSIDTEELGDMLWNEDWTTYDVSSMTVFNEEYPTIKDEDFYEDTLSADGITKLDLELGGCEVKLEASPDADFHVTVENISAFQAYAENSTLYVKGVRTGTWTGGLNTNMKVTLQVPEGVTYEQVELSLGAGDFQIQTLTATTVDAEVGAGRLQFTGLQAEYLDVELGAGQVKIEEAEVFVNADLEVGAGELVFAGRVPGDLKAECAMGNMEIRISGSTEADHNLAMDCVAGNLTVGSETYSGVAEQKIDNNASSDYDLECAMGNLTLIFE